MNPELLQKYKPALLKMARGYTRDPGEQQDYAQEAWIEIWKMLKDGKLQNHPNVDAVLMMRANWKMNRLLRGKSLGNPTSKRDPGSTATPIPVESDKTIWDKLLQSYDALEMAYHYGEIGEAVDELSPQQKEYVHLRFWQGYTTTDLDKFYGRHTSQIWHKAKKKLKEDLAHLKEDL